MPSRAGLQNEIISHFGIHACACKHLCHLCCVCLFGLLLHPSYHNHTNTISLSCTLLKNVGVYLKCHKIQLNIICGSKLRFSQLVSAGVVRQYLMWCEELQQPMPFFARSRISIAWLRLISETQTIIVNGWVKRRSGSIEIYFWFQIGIRFTWCLIELSWFDQKIQMFSLENLEECTNREKDN